MKIIVNSDRSIQKEYEGSEINDGSQNENRVTTITFEVPEDYSSFAKRIVFITKDGNYFDEIVNDEYVLKNNVTKYKKLLAFVWLVNSTTHQDFRSEAFPLEFNYNENFTGSVPSEEELSEIELLFEQLEALIAEVESIDNLTYEIVEELPTEDIDPHVIYMILREDTEPNNIYDEWMYINEEWELIGTTAIDLQPLQKEIDEINEMLFTHTEVESVNNEVSLNGNPNLEMNVTELDGRTEQDSTKGYQLFSTTLEQGTINSSSGQNTSSDTIIRSVGYCNIEPSTEYTIDISTNKSVGLRYYDANGDFISSVNAAATPRTFTSVENAYKIRFIFTSTTDTTAKVTFEKGSSVHEWEPYTHGASPNPDYPQTIKSVTGNQNVVVRGKNLADWSTISYTNKNGASSTRTGSEYSVTCASNAQYGFVEFSQEVLNLKPDTDYVFMAKIKSTTNANGSRIRANANITSTGTENYSSSTTSGNIASITFKTPSTIPSNGAIGLYPFGEGETAVYTDIMICESSNTATPFEPYITPITKQLSLGDRKVFEGDYLWIDKTTGKKYHHHKMGTKTLNGTESWTYYTIDANNHVVYTDFSNLSYSENNFNFYMENFKSGSGKCFFNTSGRLHFYLNPMGIYSDFQDKTSWTTFLSNNNQHLVYELPTETDEEITGTLAEQLEAIQKLQQFDGTTIVEIQGNLPADFKLVYENDSISDLDTRVTNLEDIVEDVENTFDTMSEATSKNMSNGTIFKVLERNAIYVVGDNDNSTTDSIFKIALNNGKYAYLQFNNSINFEVSGEIPEEERSFSGKDMKNVLLKFIDRIKTYDADIREIVFNPGTWLFSPTCINLENQNKSLNIRGKIPVRVFNDYAGVNFTSFAPYASEQTYIIKLGGNAAFENNPTGSRGLSISDIRFTSMYTNDKDDLSHVVTRGALYIDNNSGGVYPRLDFYRMNGVCLAIRGSFELDFGILNVRTKIGLDYDAIVFDDITGSNSVYNNISSCNFNTIRLENLAGNHIYINPKSNFDMNTINYFEVEENYPSFSSYGYSKHTDYDGTQTIDIQTSVFHGMFRRLQINHMNMSMHSDYYGTYEDTILGEINYRVAEVFCYDTPTTETNKYFKLQVANMYIRYVNQSNALANKQYICTKKYNCGNELIQIGNVYLDTQVQNQGSLFRVVNTKFSRLFVENIKDLSQTDYNNLFGYHKAYELAHFTATGNIVPFDNSKFTEGLGLGYSGTVNAKFENSNPNPHDIMIGLYCPTGAYKFTIQTDNGNVIVQDSSVATARYVNVKATINPSVGSQVGLQIASTTQDIIFDYVKELNQDLTDYVKDTDYATDSSYGIVKTGYGLQLSNGNTYATTFTYQQYGSAGNGTFIGKGTLENVLNEVVGDIDSLLDQMNREVV